MTDFFPILFAVLVVIVAFLSAMNNGVVKLLSSGAAAFVFLLVFVAGIHVLPWLADRLLDVALTWKANLGFAFFAAILGYAVSRPLFGWIFRGLLGPDGWFSWAADGVPGGILSLFPSLVIVFFLFNCTRIAGTVRELSYVATLCQEQITVTTTRIPPYPFSAKWRSSVEAIPGLAPVLDLVDPFSHRGHRNTAALVMVSRSIALKKHFLSQPETAAFIEVPALAALAEQEPVVNALERQHRVEYVTRPEIKKYAAASPDQEGLKQLNLQPILEGFVESINASRAASSAAEVN